MWYSHSLLFTWKVKRSTGDLLRSSRCHSRRKRIYRVHGARIVQIVCGNEGSIDGAWGPGMKYLIYIAIGSCCCRKNPARDQVLISDGRGEVVPLGMLRIIGRPDGVKRDMAKRTSHSYSV